MDGLWSAASDHRPEGPTEPGLHHSAAGAEGAEGVDGVDAVEAEAPRWTRHAWTAVRLSAALAGLAATAYLVRREGLGAVADAVDLALPVLPQVMALELGRLCCETLATRTSLGERGRAVPLLRLVAGQLVAHAMLNVAPAGRTTGEVTKAALISRWVGGAEAAAAASVMQAATFVGVGLVSAACAAGAFLVAGPQVLFWLLVGNACALLLLGVGLRTLLGSAWLVGLVRRRLPRQQGRLARFQEGVRGGDPLALGPAAFLALGMGCQVLQMAVLASAVGARTGAASALAAQGVHLVTATAAVFVPGQLGAREAAFSLAADTLGTTPARAASIAVCVHLSQLALASVGFVTLLVWRSRQPRSGGQALPA
ncbi:MAG: lysylphosphatidylglycerol synthase transmembrane domain-containing protein [Myxococcales bacterium]